MFIRVKVYPNSKQNSIIQKSADSFEITTKEKPAMNRANKATIDILASYLKIEKSQLKLIKGHAKRNKIFELKTLPAKNIK